MTGVVDNLEIALNSERNALSDPSTIPEMVAALNEARARAEEMKRRSSRWQSTLSDGVTDLNADLDHDLRDRVRVIVREAEASIDTSDPGESWDEFVLWYEQRISSAIADTFLWAERNAGWLVEEVGKHFPRTPRRSPPSSISTTRPGVADPVNELGQLDTAQLKPLQKMLVGLRGSYGGILMFGLLTGLVGIPLVNPISLGAGIVLGTKAYRDDADQRLKRRRARGEGPRPAATPTTSSSTSPSSCRDRLRVVQRAVRDHYNDVAEELSRSLAAVGGQRAEGRTEQHRRADDPAERGHKSLASWTTWPPPPRSSRPSAATAASRAEARPPAGERLRAGPRGGQRVGQRVVQGPGNGGPARRAEGGRVPVRPTA